MIRYELVVDTLDELNALEGAFLNKLFFKVPKPNSIDVFCSQTQKTYFYSVEDQSEGFIITTTRKDDGKPRLISINMKDILGDAYEQKVGAK